MKAYWFDNLPGDQRLPHLPPSSTPITPSQLSNLGISYQRLPSLSSVNDLAEQRGYLHRDEVTISPTAMGDQATYEAKLKVFFSEHLHEDEEIRYILDGRGYFDVRSEGDEWIRMEVEKFDLIVLPAGIYHRFTTDQGDYIKAMRLFKSDPKWTPLNRSQELDDNNPYRQEYLRSRDSHQHHQTESVHS